MNKKDKPSCTNLPGCNKTNIQAETAKQNILITQFYDPTAGVGMSIGTINLAGALIKKGFNVVVASPRTAKNTTVNGVKVVCIKNINKLTKMIQNSDVVVPTVNFSKNSELFGVTVINQCEKLDKTVIPWVNTTPRNSLFGVSAKSKDTPMLFNNLLVETLEKDCCKKVICVSNALKKSLSNTILKNKLVLMENSLDTSVIKTLSPQKKKFDVIFIGRFTPEKGVLLFISALKLVKKKKKDLKVCLVGNGEEANVILNLAKAFEIDKSITFINKVPNKEVLKLILKSRVLVNSSLTESFGLTVLEAMALGTPVVVSDIEGPLELVQNGKLGNVFELGNTQDLANKILEAINENNDEALKKAKRAKKVANSNFTIEKQANTFVKILNTVLN